MRMLPTERIEVLTVSHGKQQVLGWNWLDEWGSRFSNTRACPGNIFHFPEERFWIVSGLPVKRRSESSLPN
jgi:hypothetical protein